MVALEVQAAPQDQFAGFPIPVKNFFSIPNDMIDIIADITNLSELKVILYVIRHTWGYHEYDMHKTISIDEFMYGRRREDGGRMDQGTGLKSDRSVRDGLELAIKHGYLICKTDYSDKARVKKSYALKMQQAPNGSNQKGVVESTIPVTSTTSVESTPPVESTTPVTSTSRRGKIYQSIRERNSRKKL